MNCNIIKDLMVLYASGECSDESKAAILEHVATCPGCKALWEAMEADELEAACEEEKETEFQQVTKEIKKRNWGKIFKYAIACGLMMCILLTGAVILIERNESTRQGNVNTGEITFWREDGIAFSYREKAYVDLFSEGNLDTGLFQGNALDYFCFVGNEEMTKERRNAAFNVQEENFGFWADLILENNRETMYYAKSAVEENLYISNRQHVLVPTSSLETTWAYYGDGRNYDWSIGQNVYDGESAYCLEPVPVKMTETEMDALADAIAEETNPSPFGSVDLFEGDYVTLNLTSKDKVLKGTMQIAKYQRKWYGLGESLDIEKDQWSIIAAELPKSIGDKIDKALEQ